jgi:hypothetical protein
MRSSLASSVNGAQASTPARHTKLETMTSPSDTAVDPAAARARLLELIKELAVVRGKVILSSGAEADYYIDLRRITLHHEASKLVGQVILALADDAGIDFDCAGGLTMGGRLTPSWSGKPRSPTAWADRWRAPRWKAARCWSWRTPPQPAVRR